MLSKVVAIASAGATSTNAYLVPTHDDFARWTVTHAKQYASDEEHAQRFNTWAANHAMIEAHNAKTAKGLKSFTMKMNELGDLTAEEYRSKMLGMQRAKASSSLQAADLRLGADAPGSFDWRPKGIVNKVKNQAQCGSCWAFSAVAAMEGAYNLKSNGTVPNTCTSTCGPEKTPCCSFSEQELVDCVNGGAQTCNTGGNPGDGIDYIAKNMHGEAGTEAEYPYTSGGGDSEGKCITEKQRGGVQTGITGFVPVPEGDESALKQASFQKSIISIGIDASQQSFQFYSTGVYVEEACSSTSLDHGVAIVGYGSSGPSPGPAPGPSPDPSPTPAPGPAPGPWDCINNEDQESCAAEAGCHWCTSIGGWCSNTECDDTFKLSSSGSDGKYWIVRNSWGPDWGMDGYILMARDRDNQCGVATDAVYAKVGDSLQAAEIVV